MLYIGLDLGTSGLKGLLVDSDGNIINKTRVDYSFSILKDGYSEQDPQVWVSAAKKAISFLSKDHNNDIYGLSISGQMHGLVILDKDDNVIRPCILWNDGRSVEETQYLNQVVGEHLLLNYTQNIAFPGCTLPKLLWVKKHEPQNFNKIKKIMLPKDYVSYVLTGVFGSDYSDQSGTLFLNCKKKCYSNEMLMIAGISKNLLPHLYESYEKIGMIKSEYNLPNCCVAMGGGDNACAAIGTGTINNGEGMISLGTSGTIFIPIDKIGSIDNGSLHCFDHANGKYHLMGCILSASSCNKWWLEDILHETDFNKFIINEKKLGENKVFFAPYLMGERSPYNDVKVRGAFLNLSLNTTREDMNQAIVEGVAFAFRDCFEIAKEKDIELKSIKVTGGGSKNVLVRKILANVLNVNVVTLSIEEGPAFGATILAMVASGTYKTLDDAISKIVKIDTIISPDKSLVEKYNKKYLTYKKLYPLLKELE